MKVLSVNVGQPIAIPRGNETLVSGIAKKPVSGALEVTETGFADDSVIDRSVHGGPDQALYLYAIEDYQWWEAELGRPMESGLFGENLTLAGVDLVNCKVGDQLKIGEVLLEISAPRVPCFKLAHRMGDPGFVKKFAQAARPGAYVRVLQTGTLEAGMAVQVIPTEQDTIATRAVFVAWHQGSPDPEVVHKALASPLSEHQRRVIKDWV